MGERPKKLCHCIGVQDGKRTKINFKLLKNHNKTIWFSRGSQLDLGYTSWLLVTFRSEAASNVTSSS